jgi:hypothetical protein
VTDLKVNAVDIRHEVLSRYTTCKERLDPFREEEAAA